MLTKGLVKDVGNPDDPYHGEEYLFIAVILCGVFEIIAGICGVHKLLYLVTLPVKVGFLQGLGLIITLAQLEEFQKLVNAFRTFAEMSAAANDVVSSVNKRGKSSKSLV